MAYKISIFNHKGGVSKTTTAYHIGWKLADMGKKVILVDADSQCNLSLMILGEDNYANFYNKYPDRNLKSALAPAFTARPSLIEPIECPQAKGNKNLFLLPGHLDLSSYEVDLGVSLNYSNVFGVTQNLPGSFSYLIDKTAEKYKADYIIIDMNPSLSSINQVLLSSSDYFIIPTSPDYFSLMAIKSLSVVLNKWENWAKNARLAFSNSVYTMPQKTPKFLGYTINKFNLRSKGRPTRAFQEIMDNINKMVITELIPNLRKCGMLLPENSYNKDYCLARISDFNRLIALSHKEGVPVFELSDADFSDNQKKTFNHFKKLFESISKKIDKDVKYAERNSTVSA